MKFRCYLAGIVCFFVIFGMVPSHVFGIDWEEFRDYANEKTNAFYNTEKIHGMSIVVFDQYSIRWQQQLGWMDESKNMPITETTVFRVGSLTKLLTAVAILQLQDREKLHLSDSILKHVPTLKIEPSVTKKVTLHQLLTHHSGLPRDYWKGMWSLKPESIHTLPEALSSELFTLKPNTAYSYSNIGYSLLGIAIENASNSRYVDFIDASIVDPLKMTQSGFSSDDRQHVSPGFRNGIQMKTFQLRDIPAGGLYSTALDISKFAQGILNNQLLLLRPERSTHLFASEIVS